MTTVPLRLLHLRSAQAGVGLSKPNLPTRANSVLSNRSVHPRVAVVSKEAIELCLWRDRETVRLRAAS